MANAKKRALDFLNFTGRYFIIQMSIEVIFCMIWSVLLLLLDPTGAEYFISVKEKFLNF